MIKHPLIAFFKLIRIENLLIIAITQICIKYVVFAPINEFSKFTPVLFTISLISTLLIAAAGYMINDYFDVKTDKINHPDTVVVDVSIKRRLVMVLHIVFNTIGFILGLYIALKCHYLRLVLFQLLSIILLWFYSTHFKKQLLVGNIVVSLLTASIPIMPMLYDYYLAGMEDSMMVMLLIGPVLKSLVALVLAFSLFAFLTSFAREVIKDMEDYEGDIQTGCKTMPIVWGIITSKVVVFFIACITIGFLFLGCLKLYTDHHLTAVGYIGLTLIVPLIILIFQIIKAKTSKDFKMASLLLKFTMLFGIAFTFIIKQFYE